VPLAQGYFLGRPVAVPAELSIGVGCHLLGHAQGRSGPDRVANLVETVTTAPTEAAAIPLLGDMPGSVVVVLDRAGAARRMVIRGDEQSVQVRDVITRAMTRPYSCRFDPVITAQDSGMFIGLVRLERASLALAAPSPNDLDEEFL